MPTIHREDGFSIRLYPGDHAPPHVHVWKGRDWVRVTIGDEKTPAVVLSSKGMNDRDIVRAVRLVDANWERCRDRWREVNG